MQYRLPAPAADAHAAAWIGPRLVEDFGAVCRTIPTGFPAYARILHPGRGRADAPVRWSEIARRNGRTMHALTQYERIATPAGGRTDTEPESDVRAPSTGDLEPDQLAVLCDILRRHTPGLQRCWYAIWEGELHEAVTSVTAVAEGSIAAPPAPAPREWQLDTRAATFELPGRRYYLFTGTLEDATRFGRWSHRNWFEPYSPNLFWPQDRAWCVASEIDFDSTLVAGPAQLIDDIVDNEDLEAWPVNPMDSLAWDADTINQP